MSSFEDFMMFLHKECNKEEAKKHPSDNKAGENKNERNEQQVQKEGILTADGELMPASAVELLIMLLFRAKVEALKKLYDENFPERVVVNFIKSNTKEDIERFIKYGSFQNIMDFFTSI